MFKRLLLLPLVWLLFCSPNKPSPGIPLERHAGMRKITATGTSFVQGANDSQSTPDEQPGMTTTFTYDYWLDTTEVTQLEYASVTGLQPVPSASGFGIGNRYPVYEVSWYDAILFCNKKSKRDSLDTVYTYFGTPKIQSGSVYEIDGLRINTGSNGYRLPTESEWEYAAREGTSTIPFPDLSDTTAAKLHAWYSSNAKGTTQPVATKLPNAFGLYDMAGNVFEWVQDWKCYYTVKSITNSIGSAAAECEQRKSSQRRIIRTWIHKPEAVTAPNHVSDVIVAICGVYRLSLRARRHPQSIVYNLGHLENRNERDESACIVDPADYRHHARESCVCQCYGQSSHIMLH